MWYLYNKHVFPVLLPDAHTRQQGEVVVESCAVCPAEEVCRPMKLEGCPKFASMQRNEENRSEAAEHRFRRVPLRRLRTCAQTAQKTAALGRYMPKRDIHAIKVTHSDVRPLKSTLLGQMSESHVQTWFYMVHLTRGWSQSKTNTDICYTALTQD